MKVERYGTGAGEYFDPNKHPTKLTVGSYYLLFCKNHSVGFGHYDGEGNGFVDETTDSITRTKELILVAEYLPPINNENPSPLSGRLKRYAMLLKIDGNEFYIINLHLDDVLIGHVQLSGVTAKVAIITNLYIDPRYRRLGLACDLILTAREVCERLDRWCPGT